MPRENGSSTRCRRSLAWGVDAAPVRHRHEGGPRARHARARQGEHLPVRAHGVRPAAPRSRAGDARVRRADPLPALAGAGGAAGLQRDGHRRPHHRAGPARAAPVGRDHRPVRAGVVDGDGRARGRPARRRPARHGVRRGDGDDDRPARRDRSGLHHRRRRLPLGRERRGLRPPRPPVARRAGRRRWRAGGRTAPSPSAIPATSPSGSWPSPASRRGRRRGAKGGPGGTASAS